MTTSRRASVLPSSSSKIDNNSAEFYDPHDDLIYESLEVTSAYFASLGVPLGLCGVAMGFAHTSQVSRLGSCSISISRCCLEHFYSPLLRQFYLAAFLPAQLDFVLSQLLRRLANQSAS